VRGACGTGSFPGVICQHDNHSAARYKDTLLKIA
jgi:hypothetical protein